MKQKAFASFWPSKGSPRPGKGQSDLQIVNTRVNKQNANNVIQVSSSDGK